MKTNKLKFDISHHFEKDSLDVQSMMIFFKNFSNSFAKEVIGFYEIWGMLPFIHAEKQVNSVVVPAVHKVTKNVWLEQPYKARDKQRFLDIVTVHGNNIYLIELKHSWNSKTEKIAKYTDQEWETAIKQIGDLKRSHVKQFINHKDFNIYRVALMVMPTYITNQFNHNILKQTSKNYAQDIFNKYQEYRSEKYRANYVSTWKIMNYEDYAYEYDGKKQIYPFISFVAKVEKIFD